MKHSPVPANKLRPGSKRGEKGTTSSHREWSPRSHHPLPQYLFNKLNIMSEREVRTRQADKPFLNFSKPSWDKTCLSCLTWRDHLPQSAATASPLTGCNRGKNPCLAIAKLKYANKAMIRADQAKKLHCAQQRQKCKSGEDVMGLVSLGRSKWGWSVCCYEALK